MKVCSNHDDCTVVYDELKASRGCPLCIVAGKFIELEKDFNELEKENTGLDNEVARLTEKLAQINCREE